MAVTIGDTVKLVAGLLISKDTFMFDNDTWELRKQDTFGWYIGKNQRIEAFWMAQVQLADNSSQFSGGLHPASITMLQQAINANADKIRISDTLQNSLGTGLLKAFTISEDLGGGAMIVLPMGASGMAAMMTQPLGVEQSAQGQAAAGHQQSSKKWWQFWK